MEYKYVIILFDHKDNVYKVVRVKNKRDLRDLVSYYIDAYPHIIAIDIGVFNHSDNNIVKKARNFDKIIDY